MELFFKLYLTTKHNKYQLINLYNYFLISLFFYRIFQVINGLTNAKKPGPARIAQGAIARRRPFPPPAAGRVKRSCTPQPTRTRRHHGQQDPLHPRARRRIRPRHARRSRLVRAHQGRRDQDRRAPLRPQQGRLRLHQGLELRAPAGRGRHRQGRRGRQGPALRRRLQAGGAVGVRPGRRRAGGSPLHRGLSAGRLDATVARAGANFGPGSRARCGAPAASARGPTASGGGATCRRGRGARAAAAGAGRRAAAAP